MLSNGSESTTMKDSISSKMVNVHLLFLLHHIRFQFSFVVNSSSFLIFLYFFLLSFQFFFVVSSYSFFSLRFELFFVFRSFLFLVFHCLGTLLQQTSLIVLSYVAETFDVNSIVIFVYLSTFSFVLVILFRVFGWFSRSSSVGLYYSVCWNI